MGRALRAEVFQASEIAIVHTVQRCVRRAFLAGVDEQSGKDYSFRKEWIRRKMESLASVFSIDVLTYSVMSNHVHLILRNRPDVVGAWSDREVAIRWLRVFPGRRLEEHLAEPTENDVNMLVNQPERLKVIRERLSDISWFMRALSEPIARMANRQDECTGRFWEGRFKAMRIVDEAGLLACAMYVDLNPVRAAMVEGPDDSVHTSAYDRIEADKGRQIDSAAFDLRPVRAEEAGQKTRDAAVDKLRREHKTKRRNPSGRKVRRDAWLSPLRMNPAKLSAEAEVHTDGLRSSDKGFLTIDWPDYKRLLRWLAKQSINGIAAKLPASLAQRVSVIGIDASMFGDLVWNWPKYFGQTSCVGRPAALKADATRTGHRFHRGQVAAAHCFL